LDQEKVICVRKWELEGCCVVAVVFVVIGAEAELEFADVTGAAIVIVIVIEAVVVVAGVAGTAGTAVAVVVAGGPDSAGQLLDVVAQYLPCVRGEISGAFEKRMCWL
jgi:hypothetical protein